MIKFEVDDSCGDGSTIRLFPIKMRRGLRRFSNRWQKRRIRRLLKTMEGLYPSFQALEEKVLKEERRLLTNVSFEEAIENDVCLERGLILFEGALRHNLVQIWSGEGPLREACKDTAVPTGACGLSVDEAKAYFLDRAARIIFKDNPSPLEKLRDVALKLEYLPKLRVLADVDNLALDELQDGMEEAFGEMIVTKDLVFLHSLSKLQAFQVRAMNRILEQKIKGILFWEPERIEAVIRNFTCVEQFTDLGDLFEFVSEPDILDAIGSWGKRDITEKVNNERRTKGLKMLKGRRFETDIGVIRRMLGQHFIALLGASPDIIRVVGQIVAETRLMPDIEQEERLETFRAFIRHYINYLTLDILKALTILSKDEEEKLSWKEILGILDGVWHKTNFGAPFFEKVVHSPAGAPGMAALVKEYKQLKKQGMIKSNTDVAALISQSDLFDKILVPLRRMK